MMRWSKDQLFVTGLLSTSLFLTGLYAAAITPYRAVVAVESLGLSNSSYAAIITFNALATALASVVMGHLSDRLSERRYLVLLSAVMGGLAYGLIFLLPGQMTYLLAFCVILPFGRALFSQSFAFARAYYDRNLPHRAVIAMILSQVSNPLIRKADVRKLHDSLNLAAGRAI